MQAIDLTGNALSTKEKKGNFFQNSVIFWLASCFTAIRPKGLIRCRVTTFASSC